MTTTEMAEAVLGHIEMVITEDPRTVDEIDACWTGRTLAAKLVKYGVYHAELTRKQVKQLDKAAIMATTSELLETHADSLAAAAIENQAA